MANNVKLKEHEKLIADFAKKLLKLSSGKAIPGKWKTYLFAALTPSPGKRGRPSNYESDVEILSDLKRGIPKPEAAAKLRANGKTRSFSAIERLQNNTQSACDRFENAYASKLPVEKDVAEKNEAETKPYVIKELDARLRTKSHLHFEQRVKEAKEFCETIQKSKE